MDRALPAPPRGVPRARPHMGDGGPRLDGHAEIDRLALSPARRGHAFGDRLGGRALAGACPRPAGPPDLDGPAAGDVAPTAEVSWTDLLVDLAVAADAHAGGDDRSLA